MQSPFLHPAEKDLPLPFSLVKKRIYLDISLKKELIYLFYKIARAK